MSDPVSIVGQGAVLSAENRLRIWVPGPVLGQGSMSSFVHPRTGRVITTHQSRGRLLEWRGFIAMNMRAVRATPLPPTASVKVSIEVYVQRSTSHFLRDGRISPKAPAYPLASGPDLDKVQRAVGDAGQGVWWTNDRRIVCWQAQKFWAATSNGPGLLVEASVL